MEFWKLLNLDGTIKSVESHSFPHEVRGGERITKEEYDDFIGSLPVRESQMVISLEERLDMLDLKIDELMRRII